MGGSASYAAMASSFFASTEIVGIVGKDFPKEHIETLTNRGICAEGIEKSEGDSFYWSGEYHENMDNRTTHEVAVNVLEATSRSYQEKYQDSEIVLLANMRPRNQLDVLEQCGEEKYVIADTMDIWISTEKNELLELMTKVDLFVINESEAKLLTESKNLIIAGKKIMELGPNNVIIKTGEHGAMLFGKGIMNFLEPGPILSKPSKIRQGPVIVLLEGLQVLSPPLVKIVLLLKISKLPLLEELSWPALIVNPSA